MRLLPDQPADPFEARLRGFFGDKGIGEFSVEDCSPMLDGHAGYTYGLDLRDRAAQIRRYVLKLAPAQMRRSGSTDIFRQAALLKVLHDAGLPVPEIRWSSSSDDALGTPFIVMARLPGQSYIVWKPDAAFLKAPLQLPSLWIAGAEALANLHRFDAAGLLTDWEQPTSLAAELDRWSALIRHSEDCGWQKKLERLGAVLRASMPADGPVGLVHGDFQPGNILFDNGAISGIVDWDLAAIGPQGIDLGWYLMMADADSWGDEWRPIGAAPGADILAAYADAGGPVTDDLSWYQAFAQFRLGSIVGLNLKLHRNGRRVDPVWERFALAVPHLLGSAFDHLGQGGSA